MDTAYFTVSDGTKLAYQLEGTEEPTLILLHGWWSNLRHREMADPLGGSAVPHRLALAV